ncbi:MAG: hypothetical protein WC551_08290 [Patescibacteria group bacterium]
MEDEELSCDISKFREQVASKERIAVTFVGKEFVGSEPFLNALGQAYESGYFGNMEVAVVPVDNETCDALAEKEGVDVLPRVCVYARGKRVGCVSPGDGDAQAGYQKTIEKLIDLSED